MVSVNPALPANADVCDRLVMTGTGFVTVKLKPGLGLPVGFVTTTESTPGFATSAAVTVAVSEVLLLNSTVATVNVPNFTVQPLTKLVPVMESGNVLLPAGVDAGDRLVIVGGVVVTLKLTGALACGPGLVAMTG